MNLRIIGDVHGKVPAYLNLIEDVDVSVQIGDFGFGDSYALREKRFNQTRRLNSKRHYFIPGNHDDYDNLPDWSLGDFGRLNETIPELNWEAFFVRGANSIDKNMRIEGVDWWRDEELTYAEGLEAIDAYVELKPKVMITHECPSSVASRMFTTMTTFQSRTGSLLDAMMHEWKPDVWIFGHWHFNKVKDVKGVHFICLDELSYVDIDLDKSNLEISFEWNKH